MVRFTGEERVVVWDRRQAGDANRLIGRDLGRSAAYRLPIRMLSAPTRSPSPCQRIPQ